MRWPLVFTRPHAGAFLFCLLSKSGIEGLMHSYIYAKTLRPTSLVVQDCLNKKSNC
jgi:hypothetical protein